MSAVVHPKCGHVQHLMEIDSIEGSPQVHIHFLTDDLECSYIGYRKVELCCHGCGESLLVYYGTSPEETDKRHNELRDGFISKHKICPNRDYENRCPNFRTKFEIADLREAPPKKRGFRGTRSPGRGAGPLSTARPPIPRPGRRSVRKEAPKG